MAVQDCSPLQSSRIDDLPEGNPNAIFIKIEYDPDAGTRDPNTAALQSELEENETVVVKEEKIDYEKMQWSNARPFECSSMKIEATDLEISGGGETRSSDNETDSCEKKTVTDAHQIFLPTTNVESINSNNLNIEVPTCITCLQPLDVQKRTGESSVCIVCQQFSSRSSPTSPSVPSADIFLCSVCNRSFTHKGNLRRHFLIHSDTKKRFSCDACENSFSRNEDLKRHTMRVHSKITDRKQKFYPCSVCAKVYSRQYRLKNHMICHSAVKPFLCSVCDRPFDSNGALKRHELQHTDEKPFSCSLCDRTFTDSYGLKKHAMVHDKIKPFSCSMCSHSFMLRKDLTRHIMIHTNEKPFVCAVCNRSFIRKSHVKSHLKVHFKRSFSCPKCDQSFARKRDVESHDCVRQENGLIHALTTLYQSIHSAM